MASRNYDIFEIYTKDPETNESGYDLFFVAIEAGENIESFPNFDEVITKNDYPNFAPLYNINGDRIH
jgi:hypothetical protein